MNCWKTFCIQTYQYEGLLIDEQSVSDPNSLFMITSYIKPHSTNATKLNAPTTATAQYEIRYLPRNIATPHGKTNIFLFRFDLVLF